MTVVVDTPIWSLALRRRHDNLSASESALVSALDRLVRAHRALLLGPICQEVLSGIREERQFARISRVLRAFRSEPLETADYEMAARISNLCRSSGVTGSPVDFQICAVASRLQAQIFTADRDFEHYSRVIPILLYEVTG